MNTKDTQIKNVIFAFNYDMTGIYEMEKISEFAEEFDGKIYLIFETKSDEMPGTQSQIFRKLFQRGIPDFSFEMAFLPKQQFLREIMDYANEMQVDLIIGNHPKSGLPKLLITGMGVKKYLKDQGFKMPVFNSLVSNGFPFLNMNYN